MSNWNFSEENEEKEKDDNIKKPKKESSLQFDNREGLILYLALELLLILPLTLYFFYEIKVYPMEHSDYDKMTFGFFLLTVVGILFVQGTSFALLFGYSTRCDLDLENKLSDRMTISFLSVKIFFMATLVSFAVLPYFTDYKNGYNDLLKSSILLYVIFFSHLLLYFLEGYFLRKLSNKIHNVLKIIICAIAFALYGLVIGLFTFDKNCAVILTTITYSLVIILVNILCLVYKYAKEKLKNYDIELFDYGDKKPVIINLENRKEYAKCYLQIVGYFVGIFVLFPASVCALYYYNLIEDNVAMTYAPIFISTAIFIGTIVYGFIAFRRKKFGEGFIQVLKSFTQNNGVLALYMILLLYVPVFMHFRLEQSDLNRTIGLFIIIYLIDVAIHLGLIVLKNQFKAKNKVLVIVKLIVDFLSIWVYAFMLMPCIYDSFEYATKYKIITSICIVVALIIIGLVNFFVIRKVKQKFAQDDNIYQFKWEYKLDLISIGFAGLLLACLYSVIFLHVLDVDL